MHCAFDSSEYNVRKDSHCKAFPSIAGGSIDCDVDFWRRAGKRSRRTYWHDVQYWYTPPRRFTMAIARAQLVDVSLTRWYHCVTRCVRRASLLGEGDHNRKQWLQNRLEELAEIFAVSVGGFSAELAASDREASRGP